RALILLQEVGDFGPKPVVVPAGLAEPGLALGGGEPERGVEQVGDLTPTFRRHQLPPRSWPPSQARARRQSLSTVTIETPSDSATSAMVGPPKYLKVRPSDGRGSPSASRSRASCRAMTSRSFASNDSTTRSSGTRRRPPPRRPAALRRACSTR